MNFFKFNIFVIKTSGLLACIHLTTCLKTFIKFIIYLFKCERKINQTKNSFRFDHFVFSLLQLYKFKWIISLKFKFMEIFVKNCSWVIYFFLKD